MTLFNTAKPLARPLAIVLLSILAFTVLGSSDSTVSAKEKRTALFGTAVDVLSDGTLDVATRDGVITLTITDDTKIDQKRGRLKLDQVTAGTSVTGYYTKDDDELIAGKLTFKKRKSSKIYDHLVGVVTKKDGDTLTVQTDDGEEVEVQTSGNPEDDETGEGSLIVTVVETDEETGDIDAVAVRTAEKTIARLNDAIGHEISLAQEKLLKQRMSDTASAHLTRLYETLDEIQAEAQAKIEAAFAEFQANYTTTLDENLIAPPLVQISGRVLSKTVERIVVAKNGNGRRSFILINQDVAVTLVDGSEGSITDLEPDAWVNVYALPQTETSSPVAQRIEILPTPSSPGNSGNSNGKSDDTISGTIVVVDDGNSGTQKVIVVDNPDGSDGAAAVTPDTTISGDEDIEPGQEVEVVLGDDGFSAEEIVVVSSPSESTDPAEPTATPSPPVEYKLSGKIRELIGDSVILDDVYLTLDSIPEASGSLEVGQEIQFTVTVDEDGRWVIVGVD